MIPSEYLRTNDSFRVMDDESYHKYVSPFLDLINVDMVFDFPLDPMHLVYLGVVKRYLTILYKGDRTNKSRYR